jgi:MFS family permease
VLLLLFFAAAAPSPLYPVYEAEWRFSPATLTAIFAVYALVVLVTLLCLGSLSNQLGRRQVIVLGLIANAIACVLFLLAASASLLFAGRALQGFAVGVTTGALIASLISLQPDKSDLGPLVSSSVPNLGLALGALCTSALAQYGPQPTRLIWWILLGASVAGILAVLMSAESTKDRSGVLASLRPRVSVPRAARGTFAFAAPCLVAVWALSGLYLSLGPSLVSEMVGSSNRLWGGVVIFLLCAVSATSAALGRNVMPAIAMRIGCLVLFVGVVLTFASIMATAAAPFVAGTAIAGAGFGLAYLGAFRTSMALASPSDRVGLLAAIYIVSYLAFSIPTLVAGIAATHFGLHDTALVYSASIALLVAATGSLLFHRRLSSQPIHSGG